VKKVSTIFLTMMALSLVTGACQKIPYKPYLPEAQRGDPTEPKGPGLFTGKRGEYVIYGR
jgi:hypothetical protein